jgi:uncharacterized integral membrane protein
MTSPQDMEGPPRSAESGEGHTAVPPAPPQEPVSTIPPQPRAPTGTHHKLRRTRVGGLWVGLALSAIVLLLLLVFILENGQSATVSYFGAHGHLPLGVALLLAAVAGALFVTIPASGRIIQLRRTARRHRRIDSARRAAPQGAVPPSSQPGSQA